MTSQFEVLKTMKKQPNKIWTIKKIEKTMHKKVACLGKKLSQLIKYGFVSFKWVGCRREYMVK